MDFYCRSLKPAKKFSPAALGTQIDYQERIDEAGRTILVRVGKTDLNSIAKKPSDRLLFIIFLIVSVMVIFLLLACLILYTVTQQVYPIIYQIA